MICEERIFQGLMMEQETIEDMEFADCVFEGCTFTELRLVDCSMRGCLFRRCVLINNETRCRRVIGNEFEDSVLLGVSWKELEDDSAFLPFSSFKNCQLKYHSFFDMDLRCFQFSGNRLEECFFEQCNLEKSLFRGCVLTGTRFTDNRMSGCDFREATGYHIDIQSNYLKKSRFSYPEAIRLLEGLEIMIE